MRALRIEYLLAVAAAGVLAALSACAAAGVAGAGGLLDFRDDGQGVAALGLVVMSALFAGAALACGSLAGGGRQRTLAAVADVAVQATLLIAVAFMFASIRVNRDTARVRVGGEHAVLLAVL